MPRTCACAYCAETYQRCPPIISWRNLCRRASRSRRRATSALCRAHRSFTAAEIRALPSAVFGPVDMPPWNLQRPFSSALAWHGVPRRLRAPQHVFFRPGICCWSLVLSRDLEPHDAHARAHVLVRKYLAYARSAPTPNSANGADTRVPSAGGFHKAPVPRWAVACRL